MGRVVWASEATGQRPALEFFEQLSEKEAAKVQALFERLAETRPDQDNEQFKKLGDQQGHAIWEFKSYQLRFWAHSLLVAGSSWLTASGKRRTNSARPISIGRQGF